MSLARTVLILDASPGSWAKIAQALLPPSGVFPQYNGNSASSASQADATDARLDSASAAAVAEGLSRAAAGFVRAARMLRRCPRDPLVDGHWDMLPTSFAAAARSERNGHSKQPEEQQQGRAQSAVNLNVPPVGPVAGDVNVLWAGRRSLRWGVPRELASPMGSVSTSDQTRVTAAGDRRAHSSSSSSSLGARSWIDRLTSRVQGERAASTEADLLRSVAELVIAEQAQDGDSTNVKEERNGEANGGNDVSMPDATHAEFSVKERTSSAALAAALSTALSFLHTHSRRDARRLDIGAERSPDAGRGRILVVTASREDTQDYVAYMNCAFAAEKLGVAVDVCVLREETSEQEVSSSSAPLPLLLQIAHLTGGAYLKVPLSQLVSARLSHAVVEDRELDVRVASLAASLLQVLVQGFLASTERNELLSPLASSQNIDLRTSCFCHGTPLEHGYVCSVCLSVFCKAQNICTSCNTEFGAPRV